MGTVETLPVIRVERWCFLCGNPLTESPDKEAPFRCVECFKAVAMNEADGEL